MSVDVDMGRSMGDEVLVGGTRPTPRGSQSPLTRCKPTHLVGQQVDGFYASTKSAMVRQDKPRSVIISTLCYRVLIVLLYTIMQAGYW